MAHAGPAARRQALLGAIIPAGALSYLVLSPSLLGFDPGLQPQLHRVLATPRSVFERGSSSLARSINGTVFGPWCSTAIGPDHAVDPLRVRGRPSLKRKPEPEALPPSPVLVADVASPAQAADLAGARNLGGRSIEPFGAGVGRLWVLFALLAVIILGLGVGAVRVFLAGTLNRGAKAWAGAARDNATIARCAGSVSKKAASLGPHKTELILPADLQPDLLALVDRLMARTGVSAGVRTLVTSEVPMLDVFPEAMGLVGRLERAGQQVVIVVWSLSRLELPPWSKQRQAGLAEVLRGSATFEHVIARLPGARAHIIQPGEVQGDVRAVLNPDRLNLTLDALDAAYQQVVVVARYDDARRLFAAIEGRFDAAVMVTPRCDKAGAGSTRERLLGFEVTGIDIVTAARA